MMSTQTPTSVSSPEEAKSPIQKFTLSRLVEEYEGGILIPMIQRDYAQGRPSWRNSRQRFLEDIRKALSGERPLHLDFVYGIKKPEDKVEVFCPLDGQQRLTTLFLLHWYLAARDGCFVEFQNTFRAKSDADWTTIPSKFTYQVRPGGRSFFQALVENAPSAEECKTNEPPNWSLTGWFRQQSWFRTIWERDPSVAGALAMLDAIREVFHQAEKATYQQLANGDQITFQRLDLEAVGLHDDLYLRMNARGRPLTTFETFKARFEKRLDPKKHDASETEMASIFPESSDLSKCTVQTPKEFSDKIDGVWLDFIWNRYGPQDSNSEDTSSVDKVFINLFRAVALASLVPTQTNTKDKIEKEKAASKDAEYVQSLSSGEPDYDDFENGGWLTPKFTTHLIHVLEACESCKRADFETTQNFILFQEPWFGKGRLLDLVVRHDGKKPDYADFLQFAAYVRFLTAHGPVLGASPPAEFNEWNRVVRNLVINSTVGANTFLKILSGLDQLMEGSKERGILNFLADTDEEISGFSKDQVKEERLKARLIRANETGWRLLIEQAENHRYFRGQIDFLLKFSSAKDPTSDQTHVRENFRKYSKLAEEMFGDDGLMERPENDYLWERALLACGDYLLPDDSPYSFCDNYASSGATWKCLLEKDHQGKRGLLKKLWDLRLENRSLLEIAAIPSSDLWRTVFCSNLEAWRYCLRRRIRYERRANPSPRIFLLRGERRTANNTFEELHSFCFRNSEGLSTNSPVDTGRFAPLKYSGPGYVSASFHPHLKFEITHKDATHVFQFYCYCHEDDGFSLRIPRKGLDEEFTALLQKVGFGVESTPWWLEDHLVLRQTPGDPLDGTSFLDSVAKALQEALPPS